MDRPEKRPQVSDRWRGPGEMPGYRSSRHPQPAAFSQPTGGGQVPAELRQWEPEPTATEDQPTIPTSAPAGRRASPGEEAATMPQHDDSEAPDPLEEPLVEDDEREPALGARSPAPTEDGEEEAGHSAQQYLGDSVREPYGGAAGTGAMVPYGGRRFAYGRETAVSREYGQLYGHDQRHFGHRRASFYAAAGARPWWESEPGTGEDGGDDGSPDGGDQEIAAEVFQVLAEADWIEVADLEVEVSDGVVTLSGEVEGSADRTAAEELAAEVAGVVEVVNGIRARRSARRRPLA